MAGLISNDVTCLLFELKFFQHASFSRDKILESLMMNSVSPRRSAPGKLGGLLCGVVVAAACVIAAPLPASAAYVLEPGDVLQLSIASLPALHDRTMVDVDGRVHLPLLPPLQAAGLTLDQLLAQLRQQFPLKHFRQAEPDGRDGFVAIDPDEITVEVAEYRPVYVRGDVDKPGAIAFRPGLKVQQAIALAGDLDILRSHMENPVLQSSDLRAENQSVWIEYVRNQARSLLLEAEINGTAVPDLTKALKAPLPGDVLQSIAKIENQQVLAEISDFNREIQYLQRGAANAQTHIDALIKPRDDAQKNEASDAAYEKQLSALLDKGVIAHDRITDQQRSLLESTQRFLDYSQRISEFENSRDDFNRRSERFVDQHRATLLKELQEVSLKIASEHVRLQSVSEKLIYTGAVRSQALKGNDTSPTISIHRSDADGVMQDIEATKDTELMPGDVVEVSLKTDVSLDAMSH